MNPMISTELIFNELERQAKEQGQSSELDSAIQERLDEFLWFGVDPAKIAAIMTPVAALKNFENLSDYGKMRIDQIIDRMSSAEIRQNLQKLTMHGARAEHLRKHLQKDWSFSDILEKQVPLNVCGFSNAELLKCVNKKVDMLKIIEAGLLPKYLRLVGRNLDDALLSEILFDVVYALEVRDEQAMEIFRALLRAGANPNIIWDYIGTSIGWSEILEDQAIWEEQLGVSLELKQILQLISRYDHEAAFVDSGKLSQLLQDEDAEMVLDTLGMDYITRSSYSWTSLADEIMELCDEYIYVVFLKKLLKHFAQPEQQLKYAQDIVWILFMLKDVDVAVDLTFYDLNDVEEILDVAGFYEDDPARITLVAFYNAH